MNFKTACSLVLAIISVNLALAQPQKVEIEKYIRKAQKDWNVPGMAVAVVKDGEIFLNSGYGVLKEGEKQKVDENTLFAIASNTKAFVSSALGVLADQHKVQFNDKVQRYIPEFQLYDSYVSGEATIADVLSHRVGLGTYSGDIIWYKSNFTSREVLERIKFVPQKYSFRGGYGYSNLMFITAGEIIKEASGKSWDQYISQVFLMPLKMDRTITSVKELDRKGNFAIPHKPVDEENVPIDWTNWDNMGAAGGIISSSTDMAKWLIFQLNNGIHGNDTILQPETQNRLWTPHNNYFVSAKAREANAGTNFSGYGLGWSVKDYYGNRMISHGGGYDGMYSQVAMIPELDLGIVILTNTMKGIASPVRQFIVNAFMEVENKDWSALALEKQKKKPSRMERTIKTQKSARVKNTQPTIQIESLTGEYHTKMLGEISISNEGDELKLEFKNAPDLSAYLEHWHYNTWQINWKQTHAWFDFGTIQFHHDNNMKVIGFEFDVPNNDIFFHELKVSRTD